MPSFLNKQIVLDTETTGLSYKEGHRLIEIGCVELSNYLPTQRFYHCYINPEREVSPGAFRVHGLSTDFLRSHKTFKEIAHDFLTFIGESTLIIHNAPFDKGFINFQLNALGLPSLKNPIIDTLEEARKKFPGSPASLDALCKRFDISLQDRNLHGALLDARLLASVYLELRGGIQQNLHFEEKNLPIKSYGPSEPRNLKNTQNIPKEHPFSWRIIPISPSLEERIAHETMIEAVFKNS
jgi:DNA polymerase III subunit epsilon